MSETLRKYGAKYNTTFCSLCGLSTDTKPTGSFDGVGIANGSEFIEMDTGKKYMYDAESSVWNEVSSGGGAVTVVMNGKKIIKSIKIKPEVVDPNDVEMLEDLILTAVSEGVKKAEEVVEAEMGKFNVPGGLNGLL